MASSRGRGESHYRTTGEDTLVEPAVAPPGDQGRVSTTPPLRA